MQKFAQIFVFTALIFAAMLSMGREIGEQGGGDAVTDNWAVWRAGLSTLGSYGVWLYLAGTFDKIVPSLWEKDNNERIAS